LKNHVTLPFLEVETALLPKYLKTRNALENRGIAQVISPRKDAKIKRHGNSQRPPLPRDEAVRGIRKYGRKAWKQHIGYHRRSRAETAMF
jgi:hypothetical protein